MIPTESPLRYPPAPWHMRGRAWVGIFRADRALPLPVGLEPLGSQRWLVLGLVRYLSGTLHYDELIVGSLARRGLRVGLHVAHIWVNDRQSLAGGRNIWGLPKQLATFDWQGASVRVADAAGPIVKLAVQPKAAWLPRLPVIMPSFGQLDNRWLLLLAHGQARLGRGGHARQRLVGALSVPDW